MYPALFNYKGHFSYSLKHFLIHELDAISLFSLAIKAANINLNHKETINNSNKQDLDIHPKPNSSEKNLDGGTNNQMANEHKLETKDDFNLKIEIQKILNNESITSDSKTDAIVDLILKHKRKKIVKSEREKLPPAQSKLLLEGGAMPDNDSLTDIQQFPNQSSQITHHDEIKRKKKKITETKTVKKEKNPRKIERKEKRKNGGKKTTN